MMSNSNLQQHYHTETQRFFNTPPTQPIQGSLLKTFWQMIINKQQFMPPKALPQQRPNWQDFLAPSSKIKLIWFGHSSFMLRIADKTLFIDPVFAKTVSPIGLMMYRFHPPVITLDELPHIDYILYTHNHYDHLDKAVVKHFVQHQTSFIVPLGLDKILQQWGIASQRIQCLDWWQPIDITSFKITATPARHNTARGLFDKDKTLWCGYVFETQHEKIYYSGDSSYGDGRHFKQIGQHWQGFDLALIENGQYHTYWYDNHLFPQQTIQAVQDVQAQCFMPVHWGAYALSTHTWNEPVQQSIALAQQFNIATLTPMLGQVVDLDSITSYWWENI